MAPWRAGNLRGAICSGQPSALIASSYDDHGHAQTTQFFHAARDHEHFVAAAPLTGEIFLKEIADLHDRIERGPHWDTVELIEVRRINHTDSAQLTLEQAEDLGKRTFAELYGR
jgi:hypothetical protein